MQDGLTVGKSHSPDRKTHLLYLDGVRACAAIYVVIHHATLKFRPAGLSPVIGAVLQFFAYGSYAVDVFIVLSGFCLMIPIVKNDYVLTGGTLLFYRKRTRRILPPYFLAIGVSLVLIYFLIGRNTGAIWDITIPVTHKGLITHAFLVQDLFKDTAFQINYVLWSVSVEWRIYFLFPLLVYCWQRLGAGLGALVAMAGAATLMVATFVVQRRFPALNLSMGSCPHFIALFGFGMLAADIALSKKRMSVWRTRVPWSGLLTGMTVLLIVVSTVTIHGRELPWQAVDVVVGLWTMCVLVVAARKPQERHAYTPMVRFLSWSPLVFAGTFAYSIYLIHAPLLQVLSEYVIAPLHVTPLAAEALLTLLGVPLIIALAYVFFLTCEKPFLNKRKAASTTQTELNAVLQPAP